MDTTLVKRLQQIWSYVEARGDAGDAELLHVLGQAKTAAEKLLADSHQQEDHLAEARAWVAELQQERDELIDIIVADSTDLPGLRTRLAAELAVIDEQIAKSNLQTPAAPTSSVIDDIGSPT